MDIQGGRIFAIDNTPDDLKVRLTSIHFEGAASTWHQAIMQAESGPGLLSDWIQYCALIIERFDS